MHDLVVEIFNQICIKENIISLYRAQENIILNSKKLYVSWVLLPYFSDRGVLWYQAS